MSSLSFFPVRLASSIPGTRLTQVVVGEDEEVSIKEVADAIVKAVGFEGKYSVRRSNLSPFLHTRLLFSLIQLARTANSGNQPRTRNS